MQIDHVVALSNAWQTGAQALSRGRFEDFANDPLNLLAVDGPTNQQKGDGDYATWQPRPAYRCEYVARQVAVKARYGLWVTAAERDAMASTLQSCPARGLPTAAEVAVPDPVLPTRAPKPATSSAAASGVFRSCAEVRAAGAAPLRRGDPGWSARLDRDGDGVACES